MSEAPAQLAEEIRSTVSVGDFIGFRQGDAYVVGEIIEAGHYEVTCREFVHMTKDIIVQFSLQPLTQSLYPVSSQLALTELVGTSSVVVMHRLEIVDIIFVVPVGEVESGIVHMTGVSNLFVIRYEIIDGTQIKNYAPSYYFLCRMFQPLNVRLFLALNCLARNLKKQLFNSPSSTVTRKTFQMDFPSEAFFYLFYRISDPSAVKGYMCRKQRIIMHYDTLKSESMAIMNTIMYVRVFTKSALAALRCIVGRGIGIGTAREKPTKARPIQYCCICSYILSVECTEV